MIVSPFSISVPVSSFHVPCIRIVDVTLELLPDLSLHEIKQVNNKTEVDNFSIGN